MVYFNKLGMNGLHVEWLHADTQKREKWHIKANQRSSLKAVQMLR